MSIVRKRRTREHVIADLSVNHVERQALLCGHTVERTRSDYGYDLSLTTYDTNGEPESGEIYLQIKATDALPQLKARPVVPWRITRSDLARWQADPSPVILVVYDAPNDTAYWVYIQRYFQAQSGFSLFSAPQTITIHIPLADSLNGAAIKQFARFRDALARQRRKGLDHGR